jgi:hypothetical protein
MMVGRRTGVTVLALLALVFLFTSQADSMTLPSFTKHEVWVRNESTFTHRHGGSVFSPTGDPDEIAAINPPGFGRLNGERGDLIDAQLAHSSWATNFVGVNSAFLRYLVHFFQMTR